MKLFLSNMNAAIESLSTLVTSIQSNTDTNIYLVHWTKLPLTSICVKIFELLLLDCIRIILLIEITSWRNCSELKK